MPASVSGTERGDLRLALSEPLASPKPADKAAGEGGSPDYFALMMTVFMNASPMLSDVASPRSATAMCTMRRS